MNDTTLPIKQREKQASSGPSTATTVAANNPDAAKMLARLKLQNLPRKAGARRGFGLHDWNALLRASKDLAQRKGQPLRRDIPMQEVQQHSSVHDGWVVFYGKVYNLSPYLPYHPGGEAILKQVLGKDGTALFEKYHRWVNIERLIGPLLLGTVDKRGLRSDDDDEEDEEVIPYIPTDAAVGLMMPPPPPRQRPPVSLLGGGKTDQLDDNSDHSHNFETRADLNPWERPL